MGKVSPTERQSKNGRQKRRLRNAKNKFLKPGALAQLRDSRASGSKSCTDLGKKRVAVCNGKQTVGGDSEPRQHKTIDQSPTLLSPVRFQFAPAFGASDLLSPSNLGNTPKTPRAEGSESESRLESLPLDLLVKILCHLHHDQLRAVFHVSQKIRKLCHLHHDQLRAVFHVSQKIRKAVGIARQFHFNYTTPDRSRQEMLNTMTPLPTEHWPFMGKRGEKGTLIASPHTPKAPKQAPRPPSRLKFTEMRQVAAVLFQDSSFSLVPSVIQKPICSKSLASNRVLFYEDELCQAVAQNKLR